MKKISHKIIILLVAVIIVISLVSIVLLSNKKMSKEEMLRIASKLEQAQLYKEIDENISKVKEKYEKNIYIYILLS